MPRRLGLEDRCASDQLHRSFPRVGIQPLPDPYRPGRVNGSDVGVSDPGDPLSFFVLGDVGGIKAPGPQNAVSVGMEQRQSEVAFALILGDVVYYHGQELGAVDDSQDIGPVGPQTGYMDQFYEPYGKFVLPILAFPGNHDGDPQPGDTSLSGFMTNFCDSQPQN